MSKDNSKKSQQDKNNKGTNRVALKDESNKNKYFNVNESKPETITSHFDSPPSPADKSSKDKK
jgi:hypothetical protein